MRVAVKDLQLEHLAVIYAGLLRYPLDKKVTAVPLQDIASATKDPSVSSIILRQ